MNANLIAWFEIIFNVAYLTAVWGVVALRGAQQVAA